LLTGEAKLETVADVSQATYRREMDSALIEGWKRRSSTQNSRLLIKEDR